jgi:hypothetical protein
MVMEDRGRSYGTVSQHHRSPVQKGLGELLAYVVAHEPFAHYGEAQRST